MKHGKKQSQKYKEGGAWYHDLWELLKKFLSKYLKFEKNIKNELQRRNLPEPQNSIEYFESLSNEDQQILEDEAADIFSSFYSEEPDEENPGRLYSNDEINNILYKVGDPELITMAYEIERMKQDKGGRLKKQKKTKKPKKNVKKKNKSNPYSKMSCPEIEMIINDHIKGNIPKNCIHNDKQNKNELLKESINEDRNINSSLLDKFLNLLESNIAK